MLGKHLPVCHLQFDWSKLLLLLFLFIFSTLNCPATASASAPVANKLICLNVNAQSIAVQTHKEMHKKCFSLSCPSLLLQSHSDDRQEDTFSLQSRRFSKFSLYHHLFLSEHFITSAPLSAKHSSRKCQKVKGLAGPCHRKLKGSADSPR